MENIINLSQFDSLAACSSRKSAEVAAAAGAAIRELAEAMSPDSDTLIITASTKEPEDNSYWFHIEEVEVSELSVSKTLNDNDWSTIHKCL